MLERLGTSYIDLLLLHQQFGDYVGAWKDMERAVELGLVKSIGISNFNENLDDFLLHAKLNHQLFKLNAILILLNMT